MTSIVTYDVVKTHDLIVTGTATFSGSIVVPDITVNTITFGAAGTDDTGALTGIVSGNHFALVFQCTEPPGPPENRVIFHCPDPAPLPGTNPAIQIPDFPTEEFPGGVLSSIGVVGYDIDGYLASITFAELADLIAVDFSCATITGNPACVTAIGTALLADAAFQTGICTLVSTTCLTSIENALLADAVFITNLANTLFANPTFITNLNNFIDAALLNPTFNSYALEGTGIASATDQLGVDAFTRISDVTGAAVPVVGVCLPVWIFNTTPGVNYKIQLNTVAKDPITGDGYASEISWLAVSGGATLNIIELYRDEAYMSAPPLPITPGAFAGDTMTATVLGSTITFSLCPFPLGALPANITVTSRINVERTPGL